MGDREGPLFPRVPAVVDELKDLYAELSRLETVASASRARLHRIPSVWLRTHQIAVSGFMLIFHS